MRHALALLGASMVAACLTGGAVLGDVFVLKQGGRVEGEVVADAASPPGTIVVRTAAGVVLTLERAQIQEVLRQRPEQTEYEKVRPRYPDTVEGQWALAEWCRERGLTAERKAHLERIIELDPNHQKARGILGYSRVGGQWKTQEQTMTDQGYVRFEGAWRLPQEVQLTLERRKKDVAEKEWIQKLNRWRSALGTDKGRLAVEGIQSISDPMAVKAILHGLNEDDRDEVRIVLVETLARIGTPEAMRALAVWSLEDRLEEVRLSCLDHLKQRENSEAIEFYIGQLKSGDNDRINRAAVALGVLGNPTAIGPLIDALVTTHKFKVQKGNPGQMSTTFSSGGGAPGGFTFGDSGPKIVSQQFANRAVLEALQKLTGGVNYGFEIPTWKAWYAKTRRQHEIDARRDEVAVSPSEKPAADPPVKGRE